MQRLVALGLAVAIGLGACGEGAFERRVADPGEIVTVVDADTPGMPDEAEIHDIAVASDGTLYLAVTGRGRGDSRILRVPTEGPPEVLADEKERAFPGNPSLLPVALALDATSNTLYVADATFDDNNGRIHAIDRNGERRNAITISEEQGEELGGFFLGLHLRVDSTSKAIYAANGCQVIRIEGSVISAVAGASSVSCVSLEGSPTPKFDGGINATEGFINTTLGGIAIEPSTGALLLAIRRKLFRVDRGGDVTVVVGDGDAEPSTEPLGALEVSLAGASDDTANGMEVDPRSGDVYIAQPTRNAVLRLTADGYISRFAGTGQSSSAGDGGRALEASIRFPTRISVDGHGNVFIAGPRQVRMVGADSPST